MQLLKKKWVKNIINYVVPILITIEGMVGLFNLNNSAKVILIAACIIELVILLMFAGYDDKTDRAKQEEMDELKGNCEKLNYIIGFLESENRLHKHIINTANVFSESWSRQINSFANDVINKGEATAASWDRKNLYENICISCRDTLKSYKGVDGNSDIAVGYVEYSKSENGDEYVELIAHSNPDSAKPNSYERRELVSESKYYYAQMIRDNDIDVKIAINNDEVRNFLRNVSVHTDLSQYEQYILIPVFCSNRKFMGMLQIVTKYDVRIMDDRHHLRQFIDNNIALYSSLIVLVEKIGKGLYAKPKKESI